MSERVRERERTNASNLPTFPFQHSLFNVPPFPFQHHSTLTRTINQRQLLLTRSSPTSKISFYCSSSVAMLANSKVQLLRTEIERRRQEFFTLQNEASTIEQEISYLVDLSLFGGMATAIGTVVTGVPNSSCSCSSTSSSTSTNTFLNEAESSELESDEADTDLELQRATLPRLQAEILQRKQQQLTMSAMSHQQQAAQNKVPSFVNRSAIAMNYTASAGAGQMVPAALIGHPMLGNGTMQREIQMSIPANAQPQRTMYPMAAAPQRALMGSSGSAQRPVSSFALPLPLPHAHSNKPKRVRALPINENGNLLLPVVLGRANSRVSIYSIGEVVPSLCNSKFIYPVGFLSKRKFPSALDPSRRIIYTCRIVSNAPHFQITPQQQQQLAAPPGQESLKARVEADTMAELWEAFRGRFVGASAAFPELQMIASGEEFFGLDHEGVKKYIQDLPLARQCTGYQFVNYITRAPTVRKASPILPPSAAGAVGSGAIGFVHGAELQPQHFNSSTGSSAEEEEEEE